VGHYFSGGFMEFSLAEIFLGTWAVVMTVLWVRTRETIKLFRYMTIVNLRRLYKKEVELVDTGSAYEFKEIK
jgi:hypothetical protein